jgi:hypothetical protein
VDTDITARARPALRRGGASLRTVASPTPGPRERPQPHPVPIEDPMRLLYFMFMIPGALLLTLGAFAALIALG